ncbi:MAG: ABC-2 family transporter protein [Candidatus Dojkabacteria bacterium]|nr:ABC-2 family transporter protein [Candidatus Dojkabacteria bacterium]
MKKYWQTFKTSIQSALTYRSIEFIWVLIAFLSPLLFMQIWTQNVEDTSGFSIHELVTYYFIITIIDQALTPHIEWNVAKDISQGELNNYLLKPYSYFLRRLVEEIPWKIVATGMTIIPMIIFFVLYSNYIVFPTFGIFKFFVFIFLLVLSYILMFLLEFVIGCLGFWITEIRSIMRIFFMSSDLFSGRMFPLVFMPKLLLSISRFLPFPYFWYFPTMYFLGRESPRDLHQGILTMLAWIAVLTVFAIVIWRKGIQKYSAFGG